MLHLTSSRDASVIAADVGHGVDGPFNSTLPCLADRISVQAA